MSVPSRDSPFNATMSAYPPFDATLAPPDQQRPYRFYRLRAGRRDVRFRRRRVDRLHRMTPLRCSAAGGPRRFVLFGTGSVWAASSRRLEYSSAARLSAALVTPKIRYAPTTTTQISS